MAFDLPFRSSKLLPLVGLDIGSASVKFVELSGTSEEDAQLESYAIEPLPRGAVVDGTIDNIDVVADAIRRAWHRSGSRIRSVAMALPASTVITRRIGMPAALREQDLEMQVESEASQYIPFPLSEVSLDFQVLGPLINAPDDVELLVAATRRERVEDRVAVAQAAGLKPVIVDVESFAAQSALQRLIARQSNRGEGLVIAALCIGTSSTSVTVMHDGEAIYERDQAFGGQQLTSEIARTYGIPPEEAETKKCRNDLPESFAKDLLRPFIESAVMEFTRALQFFFTSTAYTRIDQIILAGGSAGVPGLADRLQDHAQVPVMLAAPFDGMQIARRVRESQLKQNAPALLTCCGLALRRFAG